MVYTDYIDLRLLPYTMLSDLSFYKYLIDKFYIIAV